MQRESSQVWFFLFLEGLEHEKIWLWVQICQSKVAESEILMWRSHLVVVCLFVFIVVVVFLNINLLPSKSGWKLSKLQVVFVYAIAWA